MTKVVAVAPCLIYLCMCNGGGMAPGMIYLHMCDGGGGCGIVS